MAKQAVDIAVIFEDDDYIAINKPSGLLVQPRSPSKDDEYTLVDFMKGKTTDEDVARPGLIHRLDRGTSGVMLLAKSKKAREFAQAQFAAREVKKEYIAVVYGKPKDPKFIIDLPIQRNPELPASFRVNPSGKTAQSLVEVLSNNNELSQLKITPRTGRTHQIRVHLQYIGCPIVNDGLYTSGKATVKPGRLMLHAQKLTLKLLDGKTKSFEIPANDSFMELVS